MKFNHGKGLRRTGALAGALAAALLSGVARGQAPAPPFEAYLWIDAAFPFDAAAKERLPGLGIHGIDAEGPTGVARAVSAELPFYVDHAVPKGFLHVRREAFEEAREQWRRDPVPANLKRPVCLRDPEALGQAVEHLSQTIEALGKATPAFLSLTDEPSATRGINPIDWCRCEHCAAAFPAFLASRWGTEAKAREIWGSRWPEGGAPQPVDTDDARRALFHGIGPIDLVTLWGDTRAFADDALATAMARLAAEARRMRPGLPIALLGASMPSGFGGFDWEELGPRFDAVEPYDWGAAREIAGALAPRASVYHTMTPRGRSAVELRHELCRYFLRGDRGVVLFDATGWAGADSRPAETPLETIAPLLRLFAGDALAAWRRAPPLKPQVAILHAMPATRLHWLLDTRFDGATWFNRLGSYEVRESSEALNREAWVAILSDIGLSARFVTPAEMRDPIVMDGMGALVLPRAIALADADVAAIARFAATRLVIADCQLGFFNHRLQKRDTPALDELFGITRTILGTVDDYTTAQEDCGSGSCLVAAEPGVRPTGATSAHVVGTEPLVLVQSTGAGRTAYLNLRIGSYVHDRLARPEAAERLRSLLRPLFVLGRVRPRFEVTQIDEGPRWPFAVHARKDGADTLLAVELAATTGSREIDWTALREARPKVRIGLRATFRVTDLSSGEPLGTESAIEAEIDAGRPALFRLAP